MTLKFFLPLIRFLFSLLAVSLLTQRAHAAWQILDPEGRPHPRHEAAFVECEGKFYLLGGRRIQPVDIYDPASHSWTEGKAPPVEVHHFQPVVWQGRIVLAGAMTGDYPRETALPRLLTYDPRIDEWSWGAEIPEERRRGGAGAVIADGRLYLIAGIINGHWDGNVRWMDAYDLESGAWVRLPDAPRVRDHFQAAVIAGKIYAGGGRKTSGATNQTMDLVIAEVDVFDIHSGQWSTLDAPLPTPRAGSFALNVRGNYVVAGGESTSQVAAHDEVEAYDPGTGQWSAWPSLERGRHGAGLIWYGDVLYTCSGSGNRGGGPELDSLERLVDLP